MFHKRGFNTYRGGRVPPCIDLLNNLTPIIRDGKIIFFNLNRVFCFISTEPPEIPAPSERTAAEPFTPIQESPEIYTNLQVSLATFIIGLYIYQIQRGLINYDKNANIHSEKNANRFIHETLNRSPKINVDYVPTLSLVVSNSDAILNPFTYTVTITPLNYYILFILNRMENHPGLFFANNSYITEDPINFCLANLNIQYPSF
jgi:hypothetical protein